MSETYRTLPNGSAIGADGEPVTNPSSAFPWPIRYFHKKITTAQLLALNTTPIVVAPAAAAISWVVRAGWVSMDYAGTAYATNTDVLLSVNAVTLAIATGFLAITADATHQLVPVANAKSIPNTALIITEGGGDPATGTSDINIYVEYLGIPV